MRQRHLKNKSNKLYFRKTKIKNTKYKISFFYLDSIDVVHVHRYMDIERNYLQILFCCILFFLLSNIILFFLTHQQTKHTILRIIDFIDFIDLLVDRHV